MTVSLPQVLRSLLVSRRAALESLALLALAAPLPVAARLTGGTGVAILALLGAITGFSTKAFLPAGRALLLCAGAAALVSAATAAYGRAGWVGLIVAAAAVLGGVANHQSSGVLSMAPAMAAIAGMARLHATWIAAGGWVLAGAAYAVLVVALLQVKAKPKRRMTDSPQTFRGGPCAFRAIRGVRGRHATHRRAGPTPPGNQSLMAAGGCARGGGPGRRHRSGSRGGARRRLRRCGPGRPRRC